MTENLILFALLVFVPLGATIWLGWCRHRDRAGLLVHTVFTVSLILFLTQWGQYGLVATHHLRPVLWLALLVAVFVSWRRPYSRELRRQSWIRGLVGFTALTISSSLIFLSYLAWQGRTTELAAVDLAFPLQGGTWFIGSGGDSLVINLHFRPNTPYQLYAIDVHQLNRFGAAKNRLFGGDNEAHGIFGAPIFSPCNGRIVAAVDGVPDNIVGTYHSIDQAMGNHIVINCQEAEIALVHLRAGSLKIQQGDAVQTGDFIGRVGNSGFSVEPHLHMGALRMTAEGEKISVPMRFQGRFLVRNDVLSN